MPKDNRKGNRVKNHVTIDYDALPKEIQEFVDELLSSGIDLKEAKELLKKSGTR